ncbi:hypothetical protein [Cytobacillus sp. IB215316]|nr:hypothetical protein [Cytobacillus sp. IB215316]MDX8363200.1 hypothetical protein [Cytobacillus sp. IB215316]
MVWKSGGWLDYTAQQHKIEEINEIITLINGGYNWAEEMPVDIALIEKLE